MWPENTLCAFKEAVKMGVDALEMDIHMTKDGEIVVMHDSALERTTNGSGEIDDFNLAELKNLDAGYKWTSDNGKTFPFRGKGITVPTLSEVFDALPDIRIILEIKQISPSLITTLLKIIKDYKRNDSVLVGSFFPEPMKEFRNAFPEVATTATRPEVKMFYVVNLFRLGAIYSPPAEVMQVPEYNGKTHLVTERFVSTSHKRNMKIAVWTVNDIESMQRITKLGVDGIVTDYPDILLEFLKRGNTSPK